MAFCNITTSPSHHPTPEQLTKFFSIYTTWVQNKAYYPHTANATAAVAHPVLKLTTPLQILTQNPIYVEPRVVKLTHIDHNDNGDNNNDDIITLDLSRSAFSSLPNTLAGTAVAMRSNASLEVAISTANQVTNDYSRSLAHLVEETQKQITALSNGGAGGGKRGGGGMGANSGGGGGGGLGHSMNEDRFDDYGEDM